MESMSFLRDGGRSPRWGVGILMAFTPSSLSQALFRCVTSPDLYVSPSDVYRNGSAAANICGTSSVKQLKALLSSFLEERWRELQLMYTLFQ